MKAEQPSSSPAPSPKLSLTALASAAEKAGICPQRLVLDLAALAGIRSPTKTHSCRRSGSKLLPQPSWRNRSGISESGASDDTSGRRTVVAPEDPWQSTDSLHSCRPSIRLIVDGTPFAYTAETAPSIGQLVTLDAGAPIVRVVRSSDGGLIYVGERAGEDGS